MRISVQQNVPSSYHIGPDRHLVTYTSSEKDIGVIFDERLTLEQYLNENINKANSIVGIIRRTFEYLDISNFMQLYKSLVRPHIEYANQIWTLHWKMFKDAQQTAYSIHEGHDLSYSECLRALKIRPRLKLRQCTFPLRCTEHWNDLPTSVVEATPVTSFERRLDKHWNNLGISKTTLR